MVEPHAVRWARRKVRNEYDWTRWHWTTDANFTLCKRVIRLAYDEGTCLPETSDDPVDVDCRSCRRKITNGSTILEPQDGRT